MAGVPRKSDAQKVAARTAAILRHEAIHARCALAVGLSRTEITTLMLVSASAPATPSTLSDALSLTSGTITSLIDRLEVRQLVHREPHPGDRRSILLTVTPAGRDIAGRFVQAFDEQDPAERASRLDDAGAVE